MKVSILVLVEGTLQQGEEILKAGYYEVSILVLVEGTLQPCQNFPQSGE